MTFISNIQYITHDTPAFSHAQQAKEVISGGIKWVQFRSKDLSSIEKKEAAIATVHVCRELGAKCIINDDILLAKEIKADGVHIGKNDMHPIQARQILGEDFIIGGTANTLEDIRQLVKAGIDYIGCGPFRFTSTKKNLSPTLGLEGYHRLMQQCRVEGIDIPVVGIGGILLEDLPALMNTGLFGIAISSVVLNSKDISHMSREFTKNISLSFQ
ncbi:MAG: thiamine phosphate synthase [Bacteroidales bacterium]|nr:thiamine phosphate synthase [Bacteroidales bacterium]